MFLDTNFLIHLAQELDARVVGPARAFLGQHRVDKHAVSVVAFGELAVGLEDHEAARAFISRFHLVTLKPEIALEAALIDRELPAVGERLGENDNWIAGFARYYGVALVSRDEAFDRVRGLRRMPY